MYIQSEKYMYMYVHICIFMYMYIACTYMFMPVRNFVNMYIHVCTMYRDVCTDLPILVQVVRIPDDLGSGTGCSPRIAKPESVTGERLAAGPVKTVNPSGAGPAGLQHSLVSLPT
jgi:hypothetical protein